MIGIITAMQKEYDLIKNTLVEIKECGSDYVYGTIGHKQVVLCKSGIGKVNAVLALSEMVREFNITKVISIGCAGAAKVDISVGDIVVGNCYSYHDVCCGEGENGQIQGCPSVYHSDYIDVAEKISEYKLGMIVSGDWFVTTREKVEQIINFLPATYNITAIDMESAALSHACQKRGVGFVSIRVISDNPLLPGQKSQYEGFWDKMAEKAFDVVFKYFD